MIESGGQPADLVVSGRLDAQVELAARDGGGGLGEGLHGARDAPGHQGGGQATQQQRDGRQARQLPARAPDQRFHALLGQADAHRAPPLALHDDGLREVVDRLPAPRRRLLQQRLAGGDGASIHLARQHRAHTLQPRAVGGDAALAVEDDGVLHVLLGGQLGDVLLERGEVVEQQRALGDRREVAGQDLATALSLVHDGGVLAVLDDRHDGRHQQADDQHGPPQELALERATGERGELHRAGSSQILRNGM